MTKTIFITFLFCIISFTIPASIPNCKIFPDDSSRFIVNSSFDNAWNKISLMLFNEKYDILNQLKIENKGSLRLSLKNVRLSYLDKETNRIKDSSAIAIGEVKRRQGNQNYIYPYAGNFDILISLNQISENKTEISVSFDSTCMMTQFVEDFYLEKRKQKKKIEIQSSGTLERKIQNLFTN